MFSSESPQTAPPGAVFPSGIKSTRPDGKKKCCLAHRNGTVIANQTAAWCGNPPTIQDGLSEAAANLSLRRGFERVLPKAPGCDTIFTNRRKTGMGQSQRYQAAVDGHTSPELHWRLPGRSSDRASGVGILSLRWNIPRTLGGCPGELRAVIAPFRERFFCKCPDAANRQIGVCRAVPRITCHCETSAHTGRGNPPVPWNQVTISTKNHKVFPLCGAVVDTFSL